VFPPPFVPHDRTSVCLMVGGVPVADRGSCPFQRVPLLTPSLAWGGAGVCTRPRPPAVGRRTNPVQGPSLDPNKSKSHTFSYSTVPMEM